MALSEIEIKSKKKETTNIRSKASYLSFLLVEIYFSTNLIHGFLVEIHQDGTNRIAPIFGCGQRHIGIVFVLGSIWGQISIREAHRHGDRWITHKFATTRHVRYDVPVRVGPGEQFIVSFLLVGGGTNFILTIINNHE